MARAIILYADGRKEELDHKPTLAEAQKICGGYIELLHPRSMNQGRKIGERFTLVVDEEGKVKGKIPNINATAIYQDSTVVGDVILLEGWQTVA